MSKVESTITKASDPLLREMLFKAADNARKVDPQLAAKFQRLMSGDRHHSSAICHLATTYLTRIATCMRTGEPYVLRDIDGREITEAEGRAIVKERYKIEPRRRDNIRHKRLLERRKQAAGQESQKSQSAPTSQPANTQAYDPPSGLTFLRNSPTNTASASRRDQDVPRFRRGVALL